MNLDQNQLDELEYTLTEIFKQNTSAETAGFWCDGVMPADTAASSEENELRLIAFAGKTGQDRYELFVKIKPAVPDSMAAPGNVFASIRERILENSLHIDTERKQIWLSMM